MMKTKPGLAVISLVVAVLATAFWTTSNAVAGAGAPRIAPPGSHAYGKTLTEWQTAYWRWFLGSDQDPGLSMVGNVKLMPNPDQDVSGTGTPEDPILVIGELAITLRPGRRSCSRSSRPTGRGTTTARPMMIRPCTPTGSKPFLCISPSTEGRLSRMRTRGPFYVPATDFDPPVKYPEPTAYGSVAAIWFLGVAIVSPPLSVGQHVIRLDGTDVDPGVYSVIFQNTWTVRVTPR